MKSEKARLLLSKFLKEISYKSVDDFEDKYGVVLDELSLKLSKALAKSEEVEEYLTFVIKEIDNFNKFLKTKEGREKVPYSQLFYWANKDKRLSEFLFQKGIEKRLSEEPVSPEVDMAGFEYENSKEKEEDEVVLIHNNDVYGCVFVTKKSVFFFSSAISKVIVQGDKGKILSYKDYVVFFKKKKKKPFSFGDIYASIVKRKRRNESSIAFKAFYEKKLSKKKRS